MVRISTIGVVLAVLVAAAVASVHARTTRLRARPQARSASWRTRRRATRTRQLIPAFQRTPAGQGTSFQQSYGASGEQARAVIAGLKADVVEFSLEPDMTSLVKAGLVAKSWKKEPFHGIVTRSVVVFVVRKGNPKHIRTWNDLIKPGVDVLVPNVQTSGGAKWDVIAAYGAQRKLGKSHAQVGQVPEQALRPRRLAGQERARGAPDVPRGPWRRPPLVRERGDLRPEARPADRLRDAEVDDPDREPDRRRQDEHNKTGARAFVNYLRTKPAQVHLRPERLSTGCPQRCARSSASPIRRACSRSSGSAAGRRSTSGSSTRTRGS